MTTLALAALVLAALALGVLAGLSRIWPIRTIFIAISWIPLAALVVQGLLWQTMMARLSYAAVLPPILTAGSSLFLTVVGTTLLLSDKASPSPTRPIAAATLVASIPAIVLILVLTIGTRGG